MTFWNNIQLLQLLKLASIGNNRTDICSCTTIQQLIDLETTKPHPATLKKCFSIRRARAPDKIFRWDHDYVLPTNHLLLMMTVGPSGCARRGVINRQHESVVTVTDRKNPIANYLPRIINRIIDLRSHWRGCHPSYYWFADFNFNFWKKTFLRIAKKILLKIFIFACRLLLGFCALQGPLTAVWSLVLNNSERYPITLSFVSYATHCWCLCLSQLIGLFGKWSFINWACY